VDFEQINVISRTEAIVNVSSTIYRENKHLSNCGALLSMSIVKNAAVEWNITNKGFLKKNRREREKYRNMMGESNIFCLISVQFGTGGPES
jgi:hypothetical protein